MLKRHPILFALLLISTLSAGLVVHADERRELDQDRALKAVEQGLILPLREILAKLQPGLLDRMLGIELEEDDGRYIYELIVLDAKGRKIEHYIDAQTAELLGSKVKSGKDDDDDDDDDKDEDDKDDDDDKDDKD